VGDDTATGTHAFEFPGEPVDLLDRWTAASKVVVVDAMRSGARAGTIHRIDATRCPLPGEATAGSTHALGLGRAVELARAPSSYPLCC
jgi:hydrogenase maturation protease